MGIDRQSAIQDLFKKGFTLSGATYSKQPKSASKGKRERIPDESNRPMIRLILPYGPSANRYWRNFNGITVLSDEARAFKKQVEAICLQANIKPFLGPVTICLRIFRPIKKGDLDNKLKVTIDSLKSFAYKDDDQILSIHAYRNDDKDNPRVEVEVGPILT